jgi:hypothetical protein
LAAWPCSPAAGFFEPIWLDSVVAKLDHVEPAVAMVKERLERTSLGDGITLEGLLARPVEEWATR